MDCEILIIGAGVVGLAIAQKISEKSGSVSVLERHTSFGMETSSRNSEVIHAGIYYPKDSLKSILCVEGNKMLYDYCLANRIPHRKTGKYIVAVENDELKKLGELYSHAVANGVEGIRYATLEELTQNEPEVKAIAAIYSRDTGIIDSHEFMKSLEQKAISNGCNFAYNHNVRAIERIGSGYSLTVEGPDNDLFEITASSIINCAGLESDSIAALCGINRADYKLHWCRGHYFRISNSKQNLVNHLIYPVPPTTSGLGIHVTMDISGGLRLGPDIMYLDERVQDYSIPVSLKEKFYKAANRYLPSLTLDDIYPDQSGIRPKLQTEGGGFRDFIIADESQNGLPGFINLIGIESPGLTCALSIAEKVSHLINY